VRRSARKTAAAALCASLAAGGALAQGRPSSVTMTCAQTAQLVFSRGALVLGTGGLTYDRYVRDRGFCGVTQITRQEFVPTRDNPACPIGYTCKEPSENKSSDF
jgi:hypothetical protein